MKHALLFLCAFLALLPAPARAALVSKEIPYQDGDVKLTGYLAYDDSVTAPMPGVLVIHEWWGHNDYARMRAEMLAKLGYAAFALDMYGTGVNAANPAEAQKLSKPFYDDRALMRKRALVGLTVLASQTMVDKSRLGVVGYCFGGAVALELARAGTDLKGVASFHGNLSTPARAQEGDIKTRVLILNGADDTLVPGTEKAAFQKEMQDAHVNYKFVEYPNALHAFTNPKATEMGEKFNMPVAYNEEADKMSWEEMKKFFTEVFAPASPAPVP